MITSWYYLIPDQKAISMFDTFFHARWLAYRIGIVAFLDCHEIVIVERGMVLPLTMN